MIGHVIVSQVFRILFLIDNVVYWFIPILYKLLLYLSSVDLVSNSTSIQGLIQRIYILVGVFMLFKLSFSVMNYIVNPDAFSDQSKGFSNLVRRVVIALALLVSIPWIFEEAYVIQGKILQSGLLPRLVLGESVDYSDGGGNDYLEDTIDTSARDVQFLMFGPFFSLNYDSSDLSECKPTVDNPSKHILGTNGMASDKACLDKVASLMDDDDDVVSSGVNLKDFFRYDDGGKIQDERKFSSFGGLTAWSTSDGDFAINYLPIISTICGGYLVFLLLSFCIDIAGRIIRLLFLQILSPVAVISSIDPTSSGDRLKDWAKECFKVWLTLFIRLLIIFLIIQLVRVVTDTIFSGTAGIATEGFSNEKGVGARPWIYVFLILGIFSAAKKIPELIEKATGLKMEGDFQLNPFKNPVIAGMTGMGVGAAVGGLAGFRAGVEAGAPVRGVLGGIATGIGKGREEKIGIGMMGNIRRKTYKDMTGSELRTFNPWQKLYGIGGQQKVDAEKDYRNRGYEQLNDLDTELNMVSHQNAQNYSILRSNGIDVSTGTSSDGITYENRKSSRERNRQRMNSVRNEIAQQQNSLSQARMDREDKQNRVSELKNRMDQIQSQLENKNRILMADGSNSDAALKRLHDSLSKDYDSAKAELGSADSQIKDIESEITSRQQQLSNISNAYNNDDRIIKAYDEYSDGIIREKELRGERTKIEKDIATINDQISDMKTFYHVDESTRQSVAEAKKSIDNRG
ncbi:MAG: hypothetical protein IKE90_03235 [Bacilli bacterium]|nr:hypothetical protein [Bacilli bacterium]